MTAGGIAAEKSAGAQRDPGAHARGGDTVTEHHESGYDSRMERKGQKRVGERISDAHDKQGAAMADRYNSRNTPGCDSDPALPAHSQGAVSSNAQPHPRS